MIVPPDFAVEDPDMLRSIAARRGFYLAQGAVMGLVDVAVP